MHLTFATIPIAQPSVAVGVKTVVVAVVRSSLHCNAVIVMVSDMIFYTGWYSIVNSLGFFSLSFIYVKGNSIALCMQFNRFELRFDLNTAANEKESYAQSISKNIFRNQVDTKDDVNLLVHHWTLLVNFILFALFLMIFFCWFFFSRCYFVAWSGISFGT